MCLIIVSENGRFINQDDLKIAFENNPDGAGIMWLESGRVHQRHIVTKDFNDVKELSWEVAGFPHAIHLRYCTRGDVSTDNCHPFTILNKDEGDEHDLFMMHNGTFSWLQPNEEQKKRKLSDTAIFAGRIQKNFRENVASQKVIFDNFFDKEVNEKFSRRVSSWNKVVMLSSDGRWVYLNKPQGNMRNGMWYSNDYSLTPGYRDKQTKHHGPVTTRYYGSYTPSTTTTSNTSSASSASSTPASTDSSKPDFSISQKNTKTSQVTSKSSKGATISFTSTTCVENGVYIIYTTDKSANYCLINPETARVVNTNQRLGKTERKALKAWLEKEAQKKNPKLTSIQSKDDKGRKTFSVGQAESKPAEVPTLEPETIIESNDEEYFDEYGIPKEFHGNMFH